MLPILSADEVAPNPDAAWKMLMTEEWRPGYVAESTTSLPVQDMPCEGPGTALQSIPGYTWVQLKSLLHSSAQPEKEVLQILMTIQMDEPDDCCLGIVTSSSFLLPYTMPKPRNMARTLSGDLNFLLLNVTFFDTITSGFPIFGIYDSLSTDDYRQWFASAESAEFFDPLPHSAECEIPAAQVLQEMLEEQRKAWHAVFKPTLGADDGLFLQALEMFDVSGQCRPAVAAAALVLALTRVKVLSNAAMPSHKAKKSGLRDVIELVTKAEELIKDYCWHEKVSFGRLVASEWNFWWLLQQLQIGLKQIFPNLWAVK